MSVLPEKLIKDMSFHGKFANFHDFLLNFSKRVGVSPCKIFTSVIIFNKKEI